jgi:hypothetical protein
LIVGIDDNTPLTTATLLGIQHVCHGGWLMMVVVIATTIGVRSLLDDVKQYSSGEPQFDDVHNACTTI